MELCTNRAELANRRKKKNCPASIFEKSSVSPTELNPRTSHEIGNQEGDDFNDAVDERDEYDENV